MNSYLSSYKVTRGSPSGANHLRKQRPRPSYLQDVLPLGVLLAPQPPLFEEAAQLEAEQQQSLLEVLGLLHQQAPLLAPLLLLQPSLQTQTLQLEVPAQEGLLVLLLQLDIERR